MRLVQLLRGVNILFGQSLPGTIRQMGFAFVAGTALYALWDFGSLGTSASGTNTAVFAGLIFQPTLIVSLVAA